MSEPCPACGSFVFQLAVPERLISGEIEFRNDFIGARVPYKASPAEMKDLTDFMHGFPADLLACAGCGLTRRSELRGASDYGEDPNDFDLMHQVYPRYVEAFRNKEAAYRDLLRPNSDVLEVGSHLGAFLQVAEEWNWRAQALDVGDDTSEFARARGFTVHKEIAEETRLKPESFDAVVIWNCFEQLPDPASQLRAVHRLLRPFGLLVLRVPNALFYREISDQFWSGGHEDWFVAKALAYNNLLGFPYLHGFTAESLNGLVSECGFKYLRGFNSELVTLPFADLNTRLEREQRQIRDAVGDWSVRTTAEEGTLTGPWIEMVFRKLDERAWKARSARGPQIAPLPKRRIDLRFLERAA